LRNVTQLKLAASLNKGLKEARGMFVARMDGDDISLPHRFAKQVTYMRENPDTVVLGGAVQWILPNGSLGRILSRPPAGESFDYELKFMGPTMAHPTVMFRRDKVLEIGGYRDIFSYTQDYDLWLRLHLLKYHMTNIPEVLLQYRRSDPEQDFDKFIGHAVCHVSALSSFLLRSRGKPDPFDGRKNELTRADLEGIADQAGAEAWLRWISYLLNYPIWEKVAPDVMEGWKRLAEFKIEDKLFPVLSIVVKKMRNYVPGFYVTL
jgi:hypothetical protein